MKSVLMSIQPYWCELIANGKKTIEVRKTIPKLSTPFRAYIYCTLPPKSELFRHGCIQEYANELFRHPDGRILYDYAGQLMCCNLPYDKNNFLCKKVIGEFVCDLIHNLYPVSTAEKGYISYFPISIQGQKDTCLTEQEMIEYGNGKTLYGWNISDLKIYDKPKSLSEFCAVDEKAVQNCEHREQSYYAFTDTGYIKNGFLCSDKEDWCIKCKRKFLTRPPQSWCYVESLD